MNYCPLSLPFYDINSSQLKKYERNLCENSRKIMFNFRIKLLQKNVAYPKSSTSKANGDGDDGSSCLI